MNSFKNKKHLVIDARMYGKKYGGIGRYVKEIIHNLIQNNYFRLTLMCGEDAYNELKSCAEIDLIKMSSSILTVREQWELFMKIPKCDIFWSPYMNVPILPIKANKRVVTIHDVFHLANPHYYSKLKRLAIWPYYFFSTRLSDRILTVSFFSKNELLRYFGKGIEEKTSVIYNGCNISAENVVPKVLDKPFLLFVGNIKPHKNLRNALVAFSHINDLELSFVIVGKMEGFITGDSAVFEIINNINSTSERVFFTGNIDDSELYSYYKGAKVLVFPSFYEGFGLPIVEAMHFSIPIICSDIEIFREIGTDDISYFNPSKVDEIESAMRKACGINHVFSYKKWQGWDKTSRDVVQVMVDL